MGYILFNDKKNPVEAQAKKLNNHHIEITGCAVNTSGFSYYQDAEMKRLYGNYPDFKTLYQELDESFILSNDGSVYPDPPEPEPEPEPTLREIVEAMQTKIETLESANEELTEYQADMLYSICMLELGIDEESEVNEDGI